MKSMKTIDPVIRFQAFVLTRGKNECWPWTGGHSSKGYGQFRIAKGKMITAHRFALELAIGPLPPSAFACHKCDNRNCVNPAHLFPGTNSENILDAVSKGRASMGGKVPNAKLTAITVRRIRRLSATGMFQRDIAKKFGVSQYAIWCVLSGVSWKHVVD